MTKRPSLSLPIFSASHFSIASEPSSGTDLSEGMKTASGASKSASMCARAPCGLDLLAALMSARRMSDAGSSSEAPGFSLLYALTISTYSFF